MNLFHQLGIDHYRYRYRYRCYRGVCINNICECDHGWTGDDCTIGDFHHGTDADDGFMFIELEDSRTAFWSYTYTTVIGLLVVALAAVVGFKFIRSAPTVTARPATEPLAMIP